MRLDTAFVHVRENLPFYAVGGLIAGISVGAVALAITSIPPDYTGPAVIQSKDYDPAWTQVSTVGKTTTVTNHPESWDLELCAIVPDNGSEGRRCWWVSVDPMLYDRAVPGTGIDVTKGRP